MRVIHKLRTVLSNPKVLPTKMLQSPFWGGLFSDETAIKLMSRIRGEKHINLRKPQTFNEKLLWLSLHNRKNHYSTMVDKYEAKKFVIQKIGCGSERYIIPNLGIYNHFSEIDFQNLPNKFVLKATHDSGSVQICKDKTTFDFHKANVVLSKSLKRNYFWFSREWPYRNIKPRILTEEYIEDLCDGDLKDYKFFCFSGIPKYCQVISGRFNDERIDMYDMDWNCLNIEHSYAPKSDLPHSKPEKLDEMIEIAKTLSQGVPFLRVDLFYTSMHIYFGEMTFIPSSGFAKYKPDVFNYTLGTLIDITSI